MNLDFTGKLALVTGGGKNIGKAIAMSFAEAGADVIVCDYNAENAETTAKEIRALGRGAATICCDVRDRDAIFAGVRAAEQALGKTVDILVNNAGGSAGLLGKLTHFVDAEFDTLDFVIDTNLKGSMNCIKAVLPGMIEKEYGRIINMSSISALCGIMDRVDYSAAKAGLIGMTRALAMEVGPYNVCVNCISPGAIERDGHLMPGATYIGKEGRGGTPQEVADLTLFLAGQRYLTGQNYVIDGGRTLGPK